MKLFFHFIIAANLFATAKLQAQDTATQEKNIYGDKPFLVVEQSPKYPGGMDSLYLFIANNIRYPKDAFDQKIEGKVYIRFIVGADGNILKPDVVRGLYPSLDAEALRVVKAMPLWIPGMQSGQKVSVYYTLPVKFAIQPDTKDQK